MSYWPGTNIKKSSGNSFDWQGESKIVNQKDWKQSQIAKKNSGSKLEKKQSIIIYSRAK